MSVINQMLNQLELRGGNRAPLAGSKATQEQSAPSKQNRMLWLLIPLLLVAAVWAWWPALQSWFSAPEHQEVLSAEDGAIKKAELIAAEKDVEAVPSLDRQNSDTAEPSTIERAIKEAEPAVSSTEVTPRNAPTITQANVQTHTVDKPESNGESAPTVKPSDNALAAATENSPKAKPIQTKPKEKVTTPTLAIRPSQLSDFEKAMVLMRRAEGSSNPEPLWQQALELEPSLHEARLKLLEWRGRHQSVATELMEATRQYPSQVGYPVLAAEMSYQQGKAELAEKWLMVAGSLEANVEWLARRAVVAQQIEMNAMALSDYQLLTQFQPERADWWFAYGYQLDLSGDYVEARNIYSRALRTAGLADEARAFVEKRLQYLGAR